MAKSVLRLVSPATENRTVERSMPARRPNADIRPREHLTEREVEKLIAAARGNRWGQRDATMILIAFRHGLRASELCELHPHRHLLLRREIEQHPFAVRQLLAVHEAGFLLLLGRC